MAKSNKLEREYGALIIRGETRTDLAIIPGSPADIAGLEENDIILEAEGKKINEENPLATVIASKKPGEILKLKILHDGEEKNIEVKLEEAK